MNCFKGHYPGVDLLKKDQKEPLYIFKAAYTIDIKHLSIPDISDLILHGNPVFP